MKWLRRLLGKKKETQEICVPEKFDHIVKPIKQQEDNTVSDLKNIQNRAEGYDIHQLEDGIYLMAYILCRSIMGVRLGYTMNERPY